MDEQQQPEFQSFYADRGAEAFVEDVIYPYKMAADVLTALRGRIVEDGMVAVPADRALPEGWRFNGDRLVDERYR